MRLPRRYRRFQDQTAFGGPESSPDEMGNCYSACLASLIGISIDHVPGFMGHEDWVQVADLWLLERGLTFLTLSSDPFIGRPAFESIKMIAAGPSPRGVWDHAVLWQGGKMLFDPHPSRAGLAGPPTQFDILIHVDPIDPRRLEEINDWA